MGVPLATPFVCGTVQAWPVVTRQVRELPTVSPELWRIGAY